MGAPIRPQVEIDLIINKSQHAIADIGYDLVQRAKRGEDPTTDNDFKTEMYKLLTIRAMLRNVLNSDGGIRNYYQSSTNEKKFNKILDGLARMSQVYSGASLPMLVGSRIPLYYYPSSATPPAPSPGVQLARFENLDVDAPEEVVDSFDATSSTFCEYIVHCIGSNSGEGSRTSKILVAVRNGSVDFEETKTPDVGGITTPLIFSVELSGVTVQLKAVVSTSNWIVRGVRITY